MMSYSNSYQISTIARTVADLMHSAMQLHSRFRIRYQRSFSVYLHIYAISRHVTVVKFIYIEISQS